MNKQKTKALSTHSFCRPEVKIKRFTLNNSDWNWADVTDPTEADLRACALLDAAMNNKGYASINGVGQRHSGFYFLDNTEPSSHSRWHEDVS